VLSRGSFGARQNAPAGQNATRYSSDKLEAAQVGESAAAIKEADKLTKISSRSSPRRMSAPPGSVDCLRHRAGTRRLDRRKSRVGEGSCFTVFLPKTTAPLPSLPCGVQ